MKISSYFLISFFLFISANSAISQFVATGGPYGGNVQALFSDVNNDIYAGTQMGGVFRTTDNGNSWFTVNNGLTDLNISCFTKVAGQLFCTTVSGGVCYTTNQGQQWFRLNTGLPNIYFKCIYSMDSVLLVGAGWEGGAFISKNAGNHWTPFIVDTFANNINSFYFYQNYYYASTPLHGIFRTDNVFNSWTHISPGQMWLGNSFYSVGDTLYNCNGNGLYFSTNNGDVWNQIFTQTPGYGHFLNTWELAKENDFMIAGTAGGVGHSTDGGLTWYAPDQNYMLNRLVFSVSKNNQYFFAGIDYNVWRLPVSGFIGIEPINNIVPSKYSLNQNYPNPFNPTTNIRFSIPKTSFTEIKIFNSLGQEISTLVNQNLQAGNYEVNWDASNIPSGVYFYRINSDDFTQTNKMILIK
jgi:photosystem II stability/assembly factor-like uncharacterized protein